MLLFAAVDIRCYDVVVLLMEVTHAMPPISLFAADYYRFDAALIAAAADCRCLPADVCLLMPSRRLKRLPLIVSAALPLRLRHATRALVSMRRPHAKHTLLPRVTLDAMLLRFRCHTRYHSLKMLFLMPPPLDGCRCRCFASPFFAYTPLFTPRYDKDACLGGVAAR